MSETRSIDSADPGVITNTGETQHKAEIVDLILSDNYLTQHVIKNYPELERFITESLGYASVEAFVLVYRTADSAGATLNEELKDAIRASLAGFINPGSTVVVQANATNQIPTDDIPIVVEKSFKIVDDVSA